MATDIASLFGLTPEGLSQQRYQQDLKQGYELAQLSRGDAARATLNAGVGQLGRGIAGLLGVQDPQMQLMTSRQQIFNQVDQSNPQSYIEAAKQLQSIGDTQGAFVMADYARKAESEIAQAKQRLAAANRERQQAIPPKVLESEYEGSLKSAIRALEGLPEITPEQKAQLQNFKDTLAAMTRVKDQAANIKTVGVAVGSKKPVFLDVNANEQFTYEIGADGKQVRKPYVGQVDRATSNVTATASMKGADAGATEAARLDAKRLETAQMASDKAIEQAGVLQELLQTPQELSGSGIGARTTALRIFKTVGLTSPQDEEKLSNADKFNSLAGERVLSFIKTLGTNPTDTDREFARTIGPALEKGVKTNQDLANYLLKRARETVQAASAMEKHFYENNYSLRGFQSPFASKLEAPSVTNMSADALAKAAGGKIVNGKFVKD